MNTRLQRQAQVLKMRKAIWKSLRIEQSVKTYGYAQVKSAITNWLNLERSKTSLEHKQAQLEKELAEIKKKL